MISARQVVVVARSFCRRVIKRCLSTNYTDSRAAVEGTPSDWLWQPPRAIFVGKCRAFIDAVHMGVTWGSVVESNKNMYIAEELPLLTVLATQNRIYFREGVTELIAVIHPRYMMATPLQPQWHRP